MKDVECSLVDNLISQFLVRGDPTVGKFEATVTIEALALWASMRTTHAHLNARGAQVNMRAT